MPPVAPFHTLENSVFHDNSECLYGGDIEAERREAGEGGKPRCQLCERLNRAEEETYGPGRHRPS